MGPGCKMRLYTRLAPFPHIYQLVCNYALRGIPEFEKACRAKDAAGARWVARVRRITSADGQQREPSRAILYNTPMLVRLFEEMLRFRSPAMANALCEIFALPPLKIQAVITSCGISRVCMRICEFGHLAVLRWVAARCNPHDINVRDCLSHAVSWGHPGMAFWIVRNIALARTPRPDIAPGQPVDSGLGTMCEKRCGAFNPVVPRDWQRRWLQGTVALNPDTSAGDYAITLARTVGVLVWLCCHYGRTAAYVEYCSGFGREYLRWLIRSGGHDVLRWSLERCLIHGIRPDIVSLCRYACVNSNARTAIVLISCLGGARRTDAQGTGPGMSHRAERDTHWGLLESVCQNEQQPQIIRYLAPRLEPIGTPAERRIRLATFCSYVSGSPATMRLMIELFDLRPADFDDLSINDDDIDWEEHMAGRLYSAAYRGTPGDRDAALWILDHLLRR